MTKEVVESLTALGKLHIAITPSPLDSYLLKVCEETIAQLALC